MKSMSELLPPERVVDVILPSEGTRDSIAYEQEVLTALLCGTTINALHRWETGQVWAMCFLATPRGDEEVDVDDLPPVMTDNMIANLARRLYGGDRRPTVFGGVLVQMALRKMRQCYSMKTLSSPSDEENARLVTIINRCSKHCPFDKHGDDYMHTQIRMLLNPWEESALGLDKPFEAMDRTYDKATSIRLIRPMFEKMPSEHADGIDWSRAGKFDLTIACGILSEHIDDAHPRVFINGGILTQPECDATMFCLNGFGDYADCIGVFHDSCMNVSSKRWPITSVMLYWAQHNPKARDLYLAITKPSTLPPTSQFKKMLLGE